MTTYKLHTITFTKQDSLGNPGLFCYAEMSPNIHIRCHFVCFEKISAKCYDFMHKKGENVMGYEDYIKPELLILIPVLYLIGHFIKSTENIKDKYIPVILGFVGVFLSLLYVMATEGPSLMALFTAITQGILTAGAAVYTNELITQGGKDE